MSRRTRKNIGIIGLGIIGSRVREALRNKGYHVFVWNRTPRPIPNFVGAPVELAEMCDYLQIFVSDDDALLYVIKQLSPGLSARNIVLAHSTVAPQTMASAAEVVARRGARFIEAPFTGSKEAAEKGELVYYVGGEEAAAKEVRPLLEASSKQIMHIGEGVGQATAIKLATNMVTAASIQSAAEALALVQAAGVPLDKFATAMQNNASNSTTLGMKLPKMIGRNFEPHFSVKHMLKDMQIVNRLGLSHHLELGVSSAARDRLLEQMQHGRGDEDYSVVIRKYFPDKPVAPAENGLELFQTQAQQPAAPAPAPAESNGAEKNELPMPHEQPVEQAAVFQEQAVPPSAVANPPPMEPAPPAEGPEDDLTSMHEALAEGPLVEEAGQSRGFFSRLLRR